MTPDLAAIEEWIRRQQGTASPPGPQALPPSPPMAPAAPDVAPAPAQPSELERLMQRYSQIASDYSPEKLAAAQAQDRGEIQGNRYAQMMGNATGLLINAPGAVKIPEAMPQAVKDWAARASVAKSNADASLHASMLPIEMRQKMAAARKTELEADTEAHKPANIDAETAVRVETAKKLPVETVDLLHKIGLTDAQIAEIGAKIPNIKAQTANTVADMGLKGAQTAKTQSEVGVEAAKLDLERGTKGTKKGADLRGEFQALPTVKNMGVVAEAYQKVQGTSVSPAGDMSLIFGYMKLLDPNSTVREGEYASAANAGSVPDRIIALYNKAKDGQLLSPTMRADFKGEATKVFASQKARYDASAEQYRRLAQQQGLDPADVVLDTGLDTMSKTGSAPTATAERKAVGDKTYEKRADGWYEVP